MMCVVKEGGSHDRIVMMKYRVIVICVMREDERKGRGREGGREGLR